MLNVAEALAVVLDKSRPLADDVVELDTLPIGRVLAEPVASDIDSPPYTKAMMDGYAVIAGDLMPEREIIEEIPAGKVPTRNVQSGQASRIMTGAPMPAGADAVVMIERTQLLPGDCVDITGPVKPGQHVLVQGSEMGAGDMILSPGTMINPQELGLLAAVGRTQVRVRRFPVVAVLSTGDEIVEPPTMPGPGQIRNSNGPMLLGQVKRAGAVPIYMGIAGDTPESLRSLITRGLEQADVLLLSGGVSAGKFDLVPNVLQELGIVAHFHKVMLKPGKPLLFGTRDRKLVFGLPGNPVSSFVCFELFIRPALRRLSGEHDPAPKFADLPLAGPLVTDNDRPTYWPARVRHSTVTALPWTGSADLRALHTANALLALPAGEIKYRAGDVVEAILLDV